MVKRQRSKAAPTTAKARPPRSAKSQQSLAPDTDADAHADSSSPTRKPEEVVAVPPTKRQRMTARSGKRATATHATNSNRRNGKSISKGKSTPDEATNVEAEVAVEATPPTNNDTEHMDMMDSQEVVSREFQEDQQPLEDSTNSDRPDFNAAVSEIDSNDDEQSAPLSDDGPLVPEPRFVQGQMIWARDPDGLLYKAFVRRSHYGIRRRQHRQLQVGFIASQEEMERELEKMNKQEEEEEDDDISRQEWNYFVHYSNWKPNWDRWVAEDDILEMNEANSQLADRIAEAHRDLQRQFKAAKGNRKGKIDGAAFLKAWKPKLDALLGTKKQRKRPKVASSASLSVKAQEHQFHMRSTQMLTTRKQVDIQQISLAFGLKRVLVEEWEVLSQFDMVHPVPAKVTIRDALNIYLSSKGVTPTSHHQDMQTQLSQENDNAAKSEGAKLDQTQDLKDTSKNVDNGISSLSANGNQPGDNAEVVAIVPENEELPTKEANSTTESQNASASSNQSGTTDRSEQERGREWREMVEGICLLFDQSLPVRLLYPCERSQLAVLQHSDSQYAKTRLSDLYGCEHLLRLLCHLPSMLREVYSKDSQDEEDLLKPILAKVNDFCRFLQKNQDELFSGSFRKKSELEFKWEQRELKRLQRKQMAVTSIAVQ